MPSLGIGELVLVGIVIILFVRPEDLPKFIRNVGRFYTQFHRQFMNLRMYTQETIEEISAIDRRDPKDNLKAFQKLKRDDNSVENVSDKNDDVTNKKENVRDRKRNVTDKKGDVSEKNEDVTDKSM